MWLHFVAPSTNRPLLCSISPVTVPISIPVSVLVTVSVNSTFVVAVCV